MVLSSELANQFAKVIKSNIPKKNEETLIGTAKVIDGKTYVQLDGSDIWTPVSTTVEVESDERVNVLIKNHNAVITGNITSPTARTKSLDALKKDVDEQGNTINLMDNSITLMNNSIIQMDTNIKQQNDTINSFGNSIDSQNNAIKAFDNTIKAQANDIVEIGNAVNVQSGVIDSMNDTIKSHDTAITSYGTTLKTQGDKIESMNNDVVAQGNKITTQGSQIDVVNSAFKIVNGKVTGLDEIIVNDLQTNNLDAKYANIEFANIGMAAVEKLFATSGVIKDLIVDNERITGELVGVTIRGNSIIGNTITADKLVVKGSDGLYYKINAESLGTEIVSSDEKYQNGIDGSVLVKKSIVAEKIAVDDLVAFNATIGGFHITDSSIYSGAKTSSTNTTRGIYFGKDGQFSVGDNSNYLRYYKTSDGTFKLEVTAESIKMGTSNKTISEEITDLSNKVDNTKSIKRVEYWYKVTDSYNVPDNYDMEPGEDYNPDTEWRGEPTPVSSIYPYLWFYSKVYYTDGTTESTEPVMIAMYAER